DDTCYSSAGFPTGPQAEASLSITVVYTPPRGGTPNAVVLRTDCATFDTVDRAACEAQLGGGIARCKVVSTATANTVGLSVLDTTHLQLPFPDTDDLLDEVDDDRTYAGPAAIAVTAQGRSLPCGLASSGCTAQSALLACVDDLFGDDGTCGTAPHPLFAHSTALPPPNDYQAACVSPHPPCTHTVHELHLAVDTAGNILLPMNWEGVRVNLEDVPVPRLLRGTSPFRAFSD